MRWHGIQHSAKIPGIFADLSNAAVQPPMFITKPHHHRLHSADIFFAAHAVQSLLYYIVFFLYYIQQERICVSLTQYFCFEQPCLFFTSCDQFTDWISHGRKFLFIFCHYISSYHLFFMVKIKCMCQKLPSFCLLYFLK